MCRCILWNYLSFGIESKTLWILRFNSLSMTFHCSNGIRQGGQLSPLLYNVYTDHLHHHLQATGVGCYVGGAWVNSLSYVDDMVLLASTVTALQTLLEVCHVYSGPHNIAYNTTKTVCILVRPKQWQGRYSTKVRHGNEELRFVEEFRYLGRIMTTDCRDHKDIKKYIQAAKYDWQYAGHEVPICSCGGKNKLFKLYCYPIYGCALWRH